MTLDVRQESELISGGDTRLHYHLEDRVTNAQLQELARVTNVSTATYSVGQFDDFVNVSVACTVTLPVAKNGREIQVTRTGDFDVTVTPSGTDTICGDVAVILNVKWTSLNFKAVSGGWIII